MTSKSTNSGPREGDGPTLVQRGMNQARRAVEAGVKLGRKHGPVVARKTAAGLKHAGTTIRDSARTKKLAKTGKKAGTAAGRAVKNKVDKHQWVAKTVDRVAKTTGRVTRVTHEHLVEKRYFEKSLKTLQEQVRRYPAIENAWKQTRHAFSMGPESSATKPAGTTKKTTTKKKKAAARKTTVKKTTAKKKATKKKTNRAA